MNVQASGRAPPSSPFLDCYRVLDLSDERGLLAGHLLAQLGAEVIQVEPPGGSPARRVGPFDEAAGGRAGGQSLVWSAYAAGKQGISLALDTDAGRDLLLQLATQADVLIESSGAGAMEALGLGYEALHAANPRLVYVSITGFGPAGPKAHYSDSDLVVWAAAGPLAPHRSDAGVPLRISAPQAFHQAACDAACGTLIALFARAALDAGQKVEVSAQASCTQCTLFTHLGAAVGHPSYNYLSVGASSEDVVEGKKPAAEATARLDLSGSGARTRRTKWRTRDGLFEMHIGIGPAAGRFSNALFAWLAEFGEHPKEFWWDWVDVPELVERGELTVADMEHAKTHLEKVFVRFTTEEVMQAAQEKGFMVAPIMTTADLLSHPQYAARGLFADIDEAGRTRSLPMPFAPGCGAEAPRLRGAPAIGEHNMTVFDRLLGMSAQAVRDLAAAGVV